MERKPNAEAAAPALQPFGPLVRRWRELRKRSQLELALEAGVSQRHLSFLESGRARPSRDMVLQLAEALEVPLRERNRLMHAAGYAPVFQQRPLQHDEMKAVREALSLMLDHHAPYPAIVLNRQWDMLMCNAPVERFLALLGPPEDLWRRVDPSGRRNVMRMSFHPEGPRRHMLNWPQVACQLLARLHREVAADPAHESLRALLDEIGSTPGVPADWREPEYTQPMPPPIFPLVYRLGGQTLKTFSMLSAFGTPLDITAEELRVETFFPADDFTREFFHALAAHAP